jgi:hypothetical protein
MTIQPSSGVLLFENIDSIKIWELLFLMEDPYLSGIMGAVGTRLIWTKTNLKIMFLVGEPI